MSLNRVLTELSPQKLSSDSPLPTAESFVNRVRQMEVDGFRIVPMVANGVYWGDSKLYLLWQRVVEAILYLDFSEQVILVPRMAAASLLSRDTRCLCHNCRGHEKETIRPD